MSTQIKDERVDARILSMSLTGDEVLEALQDYVLRRAKVHDYEREYVDRTRSTVGIHVGSETVRDPGGADVVVYVDKSREPRVAERGPLPSVKDLERLILEWGTANGRISTTETVDKIRDLCR